MDTAQVSRHAMVEHVCAAMRVKACKFGFAAQAEQIDAQHLLFDVLPDSLGNETLRGIWRGKEGWRCGQVLFHADGSFFGEFDIVCAHPQEPAWFVEAVEAWGRDDVIKSDLRLLMAV